MAKAENLDKLLERKAKLDAKIQAIKSREAKKARKDDTRRKVLVGSIVLEAVKKNAEVRSWLDALLAKKLTRDDDRALFGLVALNGNASSSDVNAPDATILDGGETVVSAPAKSGPVKYPVFIFQSGESYGGWSPDFVSLKIEGRSKQDALGNAIVAVQEAVSKAPGTAPRPSTEKDARQTFKSSAAQRFGSVPEFTLEWVAVE